MVKVKIDTKIVLDFGGISHELTKEEAREIIRQLQKAVGEESSSMKFLDKLREHEELKKRDDPLTPYRCPERPLPVPMWPTSPIPPRYPGEPPIVTCGELR